jgi:hypothetical protein
MTPRALTLTIISSTVIMCAAVGVYFILDYLFYLKSIQSTTQKTALENKREVFNLDYPPTELQNGMLILMGIIEGESKDSKAMYQPSVNKTIEWSEEMKKYNITESTEERILTLFKKGEKSNANQTGSLLDILNQQNGFSWRMNGPITYSKKNIEHFELGINRINGDIPPMFQTITVYSGSEALRRLHKRFPDLNLEKFPSNFRVIYHPKWVNAEAYSKGENHSIDKGEYYMWFVN